MIQSIVNIALVVKDYDDAIDFYTNKLHFELIEDTYQPEQEDFIGNHTGGRFFCFLAQMIFVVTIMI